MCSSDPDLITRLESAEIIGDLKSQLNCGKPTLLNIYNQKPIQSHTIIPNHIQQQNLYQNKFMPNQIINRINNIGENKDSC